MKDLFISYATEDKEDIAKPLANELIMMGASVWFDEFELKIGDKLRESIDEGIRNSRLGLLILSDSYFSKRWPKMELAAFFSKEEKDDTLLLPILHKIDIDTVKSHSLLLSDRIALNSNTGISKLADEIYEVLAIRKLNEQKPNRFWDKLINLCSDHIRNCLQEFYSHPDCDKDFLINCYKDLMDVDLIEKIVKEVRINSNVIDLGIKTSSEPIFYKGWYLTYSFIHSEKDEDFLNNCPESKYINLYSQLRDKFISEIYGWEDINFAHWIIQINPFTHETAVAIDVNFNLKAKILSLMSSQQTNDVSQAPVEIVPTDLVDLEEYSIYRKKLLFKEAEYAHKKSSRKS